jgi:molybdopterin molybdotransferase
MVGAGGLLTVQQALQLALQAAVVMDAEDVLLEQATGLRLATDLLVPQDLPAADRAMMDGFAVAERAAVADSEPAPSPVAVFAVVETVTAGMVPQRVLECGQAARIMTGALVPTGARCVVPVERTSLLADDGGAVERVSVPLEFLKAQSHILSAGSLARRGDVLLPAGTQIRAQHIALLAEHGFARIPVHRRVEAAVLATGNELVHHSETPPPGCIRNSNAPMLQAQLAAVGAVPRMLRTAGDSLESLRRQIQLGLRADVLLLTGGVSAGILDLVPQVLREEGVQQILHGVRMKPGKPLFVGVLRQSGRQCLVFGLPGNPVSSLACFELFVRPVLERMGGRTSLTALRAVLTRNFTVRGDRTVCQPVQLRLSEGHLTAEPLAWNSSADLKSASDANGMAIFESERGEYGAGEMVQVISWDGWG